MDIEWAFNNVKPDQIENAIYSLGVYINICQFIDNLFTKRCMSARIESTDLHIFVSRRTPSMQLCYKNTIVKIVVWFGMGLSSEVEIV